MSINSLLRLEKAAHSASPVSLMLIAPTVTMFLDFIPPYTAGYTYDLLRSLLSFPAATTYNGSSLSSVRNRSLGLSWVPIALMLKFTISGLSCFIVFITVVSQPLLGAILGVCAGASAKMD